ncbi:MAG: hypothetical protein AB7F99_01395 [Vicinamibacterales bacterium]
MLRAIFMGEKEEPVLSGDFKAAAHDLTITALTLSDLCIARADIADDVKPHASPTDALAIPSGQRLERLRRAVTVFPDDQARIPSSGVPMLVALDPLVCRGGSGPELPRTLDELPAYLTPFVDIDGTLVLVAASSLPAALTHALVAMAVRLGEVDALATRFKIAVFQNVDESLEQLDCTRLGEPRRPLDTRLPAIEAAYRLDADKVLVLLCLTDPLAEYDPATISGMWSLGDLDEAVTAWVRSQEHTFAAATPPVNDLLALVVTQSPSRTFALGLPKFSYATPMVMVAGDLEVIARVEHARSLVLWQFATASDRIRDQAKVMAFDPLDEFAYWRGNKYTYYSTDGPPPTLFSFAPGLALDLRIEAKDALGIHGLPAPDRAATTEVVRFHGPRVPIYAQRPGLDRRLALAVEGQPLLLWVRAARVSEDARFNRIIYGFVDFVAYWVWQFAPYLNRALRRLTERFDSLLFEVDVIESPGWFEDPADGTPLRIERTDLGFSIAFLEGSMNLLNTADNAGERQLMRAILQAINMGAIDVNGDGHSAEEAALDEAIDLHAPLGAKKKLVILDGEAALSLNDVGLPPYRPLQPAATEALRETESRLIDQLGLAVGPIDDPAVVDTLNRVVKILFARYEMLVSTLAPEGIIEWLIAQDERLNYQQEYLKKLIPTRIACFGTVPEILEELAHAEPELATTAIAHRFFIEYVAARPPNGVRPFSLSVYDEVIALGSYLIGTALDSDSIKYGLSEIQITVLESRRLGRSQSAYQQAVQDFAARSLAERLVRSTASFASMWSAEESDDDSRPVSPIPADDFEKATLAEFGLSLQDIGRFLQFFLDIGTDQSGTVKRLPALDARRAACRSLGWEDSKVDLALNLLSLSPRDEFLRPAMGFQLTDVYPWRFNRRLSYLSRPFIVWMDNGTGIEDVSWGQRALLRTNDYVFRQVIEGRSPAHSDAMQRLRGRIANIDGARFNSRVAEMYKANSDLIVKRGVTGIGTLRIARESGQALGDVDVLVVDPRSKSMYAIETKDFSTSRNPAEFRSEGEKLSKAIEIHQERVDWIEAHLAEVLTWLNIRVEQASRWAILPLIVVSDEAFTPILRRLSMPVISASMIESRAPFAANRLSGRAGGRRRRGRDRGTPKRQG